MGREKVNEVTVLHLDKVLFLEVFIREAETVYLHLCLMQRGLEITRTQHSQCQKQFEK